MGTAIETSLEPDWGITPLPAEARRLSGFDLAVLWGDLGIGLLVLVTGALLVPALGFAVAFGMVVLGSIIGCLLLALVGAAGAGHGQPAMVLFRPVLGIRGSWVPSALNVGQLVGWTAVELWAISYVADLVSVEAFDFTARWLWLGIAAFVCAALALWGPVGVTRIWMERLSAWVIVAICTVLTVLVLREPGILDALRAPGVGGWPTVGAALDLVIAMPVSWLPLVADYTRFGRDRGSAFRGTFFGYLIANVWLYTLGMLLILGAGAGASPAGIASGILALGGGTLAGFLFLMGLLAGETDEAFADIYSGAMSLKNVFPRVRKESFVVGITLIALLLAGWLTMERYESFLFLIGSVFVPLFGIFIVHFYFRRGPSSRTVRPQMAFVAWAIGFLVYHSIAPTGPGWWLDLVGALPGDVLSTSVAWLPASIPSFIAASLVYAAARPVSSRPTRVRGDDEDRS